MTSHLVSHSGGQNGIPERPRQRKKSEGRSLAMQNEIAEGKEKKRNRRRVTELGLEGRDGGKERGRKTADDEGDGDVEVNQTIT